MQYVIKRNHDVIPFNGEKIRKAIEKASKECNEFLNEGQMEELIFSISKISDEPLTVEEIQDEVVDRLMKVNGKLAKIYQGYRAVRHAKRKQGEKIVAEIEGMVVGDLEKLSENANKDTRTISVGRDILAGISSKEYYLNYILPKRIAAAHNEFRIHIHDLDYLLFRETNCLGRETRFVTNEGVKSFNDFEDGDVINVLTPYGNWKKATVKSYGDKELFNLTFVKGSKKYTVRATNNHRWILEDGTITTNIKIGDKLKRPETDFDDIELKNASSSEKIAFLNGFCCGDGRLIYTNKSKTNVSTDIRLCGNKNTFLDIFKENGFNVSSIYENGDNLLRISGLDFKTPRVFSTTNEFKYFFLGLLEADGRKSTSKTKVRFNSIYVKNKDVQDYIRKYLPISGIFSTSERNYKGKETNFGNRNGDPIEFNLTTYQSNYHNQFWSLDSITESKKEIVWCLEVEDDKSFVLENGITTGNCELVHLSRMLKGGCKIGNACMDEPKTLEVAVGHTVQIIASVSSNTYGGCTIPYLDKTLTPYVRKTFKKHYETAINWMISGEDVEPTKEKLKSLCIDNETFFIADWTEIYDKLKSINEKCFRFAFSQTEDAVKQAMQGLEYEINSLSTVNGQTPFTTVGIGTETTWEGKLIQKWIFKNRAAGFGAKKDSTAIFPKIAYAFCEGHNEKEGDPNWDITLEAMHCMSKAVYPDILFVTPEQIANETVVYPMGEYYCPTILNVA